MVVSPFGAFYLLILIQSSVRLGELHFLVLQQSWILLKVNKGPDFKNNVSVFKIWQCPYW